MATWILTVRSSAYTCIYLFVCHRYRHRLRAAVRRQSNNSRPGFTDEEVLTVYLFGIIKKRRTVSDMYTYTSEHFGEWFPELPSYAASNLCGLQSAPEPTRRRVCSACAGSAGRDRLAKMDSSQTRQEVMRITDSIPIISIPIMMAKEKRSSQATVAPELADKGYCSSKDTSFYGVKLHVVAERRCRFLNALA